MWGPRSKYHQGWDHAKQVVAKNVASFPEPPLHLQLPMVGLTCGIPPPRSLDPQQLHLSVWSTLGATFLLLPKPSRLGLGSMVRPHLTLASRSPLGKSTTAELWDATRRPPKEGKKNGNSGGRGEKRKNGPTDPFAGPPPTPPLRPPIWGPTHSHPTPPHHMWPNVVGQMRSNKDDQIKFGGRKLGQLLQLHGSFRGQPTQMERLVNRCPTHQPFCQTLSRATHLPWRFDNAINTLNVSCDFFGPLFCVGQLLGI